MDSETTLAWPKCEIETANARTAQECPARKDDSPRTPAPGRSALPQDLPPRRVRRWCPEWFAPRTAQSRAESCPLDRRMTTATTACPEQWCKSTPAGPRKNKTSGAKATRAGRHAFALMHWVGFAFRSRQNIMPDFILLLRRAQPRQCLTHQINRASDHHGSLLSGQRKSTPQRRFGLGFLNHCRMRALGHLGDFLG